MKSTVFMFVFLLASPSIASTTLAEEAADALRQAVTFYHTEVASHGGYVYRYSADLTKREGEGKTDMDTVWVQPPGTPAVGMAYLAAYQLTGHAYLLDAARDAGDCLIRGQLHSGGWDSSIRFAAEQRRRVAYRVESPAPRGSNWTTLDDDKTQSALRMLMQLDQALDFDDQEVHEASRFALQSLLRAQYPNGAWPQRYREAPDPGQHPILPASYPERWSRAFPDEDYRGHYTFNDNTIADTIATLLLAAEIHDDQAYRESALRGGEFILLAQMPEPQPAWAQQYDASMRPAWARKFEPPSICGGESQGLIETLMDLYLRTADEKFLQPIPRALEYLRDSRLPDGRLARFYELKSNRPLYFTKQYELTYEDDDLPTHYGFQIGSRLDQLARRYRRLHESSREELQRRRSPRQDEAVVTRELEARVRRLVSTLDQRGAWVERGGLRYHGANDQTRQIISSTTFARNIRLLSRYLSAVHDSAVNTSKH